MVAGPMPPQTHHQQLSREVRLGYRPALDGIRAVGIVMVVVLHAVAFLATSQVRRLGPGGFLGVDVFFVLSGFLITTLLLEERARRPVSLTEFWIRRALRLLPALVVFLGVWSAYLLGYRRLGGRGILASDLASIFYVSNIVKAHGSLLDPGYGHLWSLAIEEQFYLVWPVILVLVLARRRGPGLLAVFAGVAVLALAVDRALVWHADPNALTVAFRTDFHADQLLIGALGAMAWRSGRLRCLDRHRAWWSTAAALLLAAAFFTVPAEAGWLYEGGYLAFGAVVGLLVVTTLVPSGPVGALLTAAPVRYLGRISYSLYLWHFAVLTAVSYAVPRDLHAAAAIPAVLVSIGLASASYHGVERPLRALGRRRVEQFDARRRVHPAPAPHTT